jgi:hypothetical protein
MKITRKHFIGSIAAVSAASLIGSSCTTKTSANTPMEGYGPVEARSPLTWLPERTIAREGETTDDLTSFIDKNYGIHNSLWKGIEGWAIKIKPTGYRGMPLWSISKIVLKLDGKEIGQNDFMFFLNNANFKVSELKKQYGAQWYNFDWATLFVPKPGGLETGVHEIEVKMTAGSFGGDGKWNERESGTKVNIPVVETIVRYFW